MKTRYDLAAEKAREAIEELRLASYEQGYKDATHDLTAKAPKSAQDIRDEIIEKAKHDLIGVKREWNVRGDIPGGKMRYIHGIKVCTEEFIVNKEKRTVVCLLRWDYDNALVSRGIAKADPSDCFNVHIGKAIALRRALGLEVPAEYYNAAQPTEVRVGDVVETSALRRLTVTNGETDIENNLVRLGFLLNPSIYRKIIDDSREEVAE